MIIYTNTQNKGEEGNATPNLFIQVKMKLIIKFHNNVIHQFSENGAFNGSITEPNLVITLGTIILL